MLVIVDDYLRFPVVYTVKATSAKSVIPILDTLFSTFGIPEEVRTDNGPPFNSDDFARFAGCLGVHHRKVTPLWPKANGEVERMMRNLNKVIQTATAEGKHWKQELNKYLRNYRATPHSSTGKSPATILFNRPIRTKLPEVTQATDDASVRNKDTESKERQKSYGDKRHHARPHSLHIGDTVLVNNVKTTGLFLGTIQQSKARSKARCVLRK